MCVLVTSQCKCVCAVGGSRESETKFSSGKFVSEHFTSLTLDAQTGVVSDEDTVEMWEVVKEVIEKKSF